MVECARLEPGAFDAADIVGSLPDDPAERPRPRPRPGPRSSTPASIDGLVNTVRTARETNRNNTLHWAACRVAEDFSATHELEAACRALMDAALDAGLDERETVATIQSGLRNGGRT